MLYNSLFFILNIAHYFTYNRYFNFGYIFKQILIGILLLLTYRYEFLNNPRVAFSLNDIITIAVLCVIVLNILIGNFVSHEEKSIFNPN